MESSPQLLRPRKKRDAIASTFKGLFSRKEESTHSESERLEQRHADEERIVSASTDAPQDGGAQDSGSRESLEAVREIQQSEQDEPDPWTGAESRLESEKPSVYADLQMLKRRNDEDVAESFSRAENVMGQLKSDLTKTEIKLSPEKSKIRRNLLKAASFIMSVKDLLVAPARFDPTGASPVVLAGLTSVLSLALRKDDLDHSVSVDLQDICSKILYWANEESKVLQRRLGYVGDKHKLAEISLVELYASILEYQVLAAGYCGSNEFVQGFKSTYKSTDLVRAKKDIDVKHKTCEIRFSSISSEKAFFQSNQTILEWIWHENPHDIHRAIRNKTKVDDSYALCGEWLLVSEEFKRWNESSGLQVFWLCGTGQGEIPPEAAGGGEEHIAKAVFSCRVNEWHEERSAIFENTSIAYVYCSSIGTSAATDWSSALHSIARQLSEIKGQTHLSKPVSKLYDLRVRDRSKHAALSDKEIEKLLTAIFETNVDVRIVIDALDECADWQKLLEILRDAGRHHPGNFKIFCSSRLDVSVQEYFPEKTQRLLTTELTEGDMEQFVRHEIFSRETPRRLLSGRYPGLEEKLALALLKRACGMFKWVELELSLLFDLRGNKAPVRGKRDLEEKIEAIRSGSARGDKLLYDTYHQIFKRNVEEGSHAEDDVVRAFKMVLCSCEPLTIHALAEAISIEMSEDTDSFRYNINEDVAEEYVRSISHNFLVENAEGTVMFSHMSAVDYLRNSNESSRVINYGALDCHTEMMHVCLCFVRSRPLCSTANPEGVVEGIEMILGWQICFLGYAYRYWARHCAVVIRLSGSNRTQAAKLAAMVFTNQDWSEAFGKWEAEMLGIEDDFRTYETPPELKLYLDRDPGIFLAACYGLPQLADEMTSGNAERCAVVVNRTTRNDESPLGIALRPYKFSLYTFWKENWANGVWKEPGAYLGQDVGYVETAKIFISKGADVNASCMMGASPIHMMVCHITTEDEAARRNRIELLDCFLEHKADVDIINEGSTALHKAVLQGDQLTTLWLLNNGANVNIKTSQGQTAMHYAASQGNLIALQLMHEKGASLHVRCKFGVTPLGKAAQGHHPECVDFLIQAKASLQAAGHGGNIWHCVVESNFDGAMLDVLEQASVKKLSDLPDDRGLTPVMVALQRNQVQWARYLHESGASLKSVAQGQVTIAHIAAARRSSYFERDWLLSSARSFSFLNRYSTNFNAVDDDGATPLVISAARCDLVGLFYLVEYGSDPCATDKHGRTALHYAVMQMLLATDNLRDRVIEIVLIIVDLLMAVGANVNQGDENGLTAIMLASCHWDSGKLCRRLIDHGADVTAQTLEGFKLSRTTRWHYYHEFDSQGHIVRRMFTDEYVNALQNRRWIPYHLVDSQGDIVEGKVTDEYSNALKKLLRNYLLDVNLDIVVKHQFGLDEMRTALEQAKSSKEVGSGLSQGVGRLR